MRHLCTISLLVILLLTACDKIIDQAVQKDFKQVIINEVGEGLLPTIVDIYSGEGDSDNVYKHIIFSLTAEKDVALSKGWLKGTSLKKGQKLSDGESVLLYQRINDVHWKMTSAQLTKVPSSEKSNP
jgi:hypothetical protein